MKTLITGGAGFIGSHLAERLLADGHEVWVLDDLSTGSIQNLDAVREHPRLHVRIASVFDLEILAEMVDRADVVFHLAAAVGVMLIVEHPVHTIETNISGTENVLGQAAKKRKKVILASTSEVYGKASKVPFHEDDDLVLGATSRARWAYAASKMVDEFLALSYWREKKVPTVVVRFFNTVGPRQTDRYGMVIPRFVRQALTGGPITVFGDGTQSRCFTHVHDVITGFAALAWKEEAVGRVFNLGSTEEVSMQQLAERVRDKVDPKVEIRHIAYEEAYGPGFEDMRRRVPDISRAAEAVGYRPTIALDEILDDVIADIRGRIS